MSRDATFLTAVQALAISHDIHYQRHCAAMVIERAAIIVPVLPRDPGVGKLATEFVAYAHRQTLRPGWVPTDFQPLSQRDLNYDPDDPTTH